MDLFEFWDDYCDIGMFLYEHAQSVEVPTRDIVYLDDEQEYELGKVFTELVFDGDLGKSYDYAFNLKPFDFKE